MKTALSSALTLFFLAGTPVLHALVSPLIGQSIDEAGRNVEHISRLTLRQKKAEVLKIMGPENRRESYWLPNGKVITFYFYRTAGWGGFDVMEDARPYYTALAFDESVLVGIGDLYYTDVVNQGQRVP